MTGVQTCALPICFPVTIRTQAAGLGAKDEGSQKFWLQALGARQNALTPILLLHYRLAALQIGGLQEIKLISWLPMDESTGVDLSVIIENKMKAIEIASGSLTTNEIRDTLRNDFDLNFIAAKKENDKKVEENARKLQELQKTKLKHPKKQADILIKYFSAVSRKSIRLNRAIKRKVKQLMTAIS